MISFEALIRSFAQEALRLQLEESEKGDSKTLLALGDSTAPDRVDIIRSWLQSYQVFQGIDGPSRTAIATAVLKWADARDLHRDLTTVDSLNEVHAELMDICTRANGENRGFTSLASKALWLCYPERVPIFDAFAQRSLWVISKLEPDISPLPASDPEYRKFVHIWKVLCDRYARAINEIELGAYPYRVRIFDKILWLLGEPRYGRRPTIPE
jgi:hypothetical protein